MATKKTKTKAKAKTTKKKTVKKKIEIEDLMVEVQARFDTLEGKIDALLSKSTALSRMVSTEHDPGFKTQATVTRKFPIPQDDNRRERKMHKAVCEQCKQECEVPFVPRVGRPVYCKTCFTDRRNGSSPRNMPNREEIVAEIAKTLKIDIDEPTRTKKAKTKKAKPVAAKAKKSAAKKTKAKKTKARK
jgi:CxxC-x17-CxxC domain-containing protein